MWLLHHVSENLIYNQGCSQKCNNNENSIHVDMCFMSNSFLTYFVDVLHRLVYYFEQHNPYHFQKSVLELLLTTVSYC